MYPSLLLIDNFTDWYLHIKMEIGFQISQKGLYAPQK